MMQTPGAPLRAFMLDPSLFTSPYDAALTSGLEAAGVGVTWITRPLREGEVSELEGLRQRRLYYPGRAALSAKGEGTVAKVRKAVSHGLSSLRVLRALSTDCPDIVHFQWAVLPLLDAPSARWMRRKRPVVLTVHDLEPFNGAGTSRLQRLGFEQVLRAASALIVHTEEARQRLLSRGFRRERVRHIPHGPLALSPTDAAAPEVRDGRWRVVLFGKLQPYKGIDVLLDALEVLGPQARRALDIVIAGEPLMDVKAAIVRAERLGVDFRPRRLSAGEAHRLLESADAFVFPYRVIEASGVLHLTRTYARWTVASDLGSFREVISPELDGMLVTPGDPNSLAEQLSSSIGRRPTAGLHEQPSWTEIGRTTRALYEEVLAREKRP